MDDNVSEKIYIRQNRRTRYNEVKHFGQRGALIATRSFWDRSLVNNNDSRGAAYHSARRTRASRGLSLWRLFIGKINRRGC